MTEILAAMDIAAVATAVGAFLVVGAGLNILFTGYRYVKKSLGRV